MIKATDLFKPASVEEIDKRKAAYPEIRMKDIIDSVEKTKLPDDTWHVHDNLNITYCKLTNLKKLNVSIVDGHFLCYDNNIITLEGAPTVVTGSFNCSNNYLTSLEGVPTTVYVNFYCGYNKLTTLKGAPTAVNGEFSCFYNDKKFTEEEVRSVCNVKGRIYT